LSPISGLRVFSRADVLDRLDYPSLIDRLDTAFREDATAPLRHRHDLPGGGGGLMLIKPAWRPQGPVAVKIVNVFPQNARRDLPAVQGTVLLFNGETGAPCAVIDGQALTNRRTAAASALAARYLARIDAAVHLVVGTGQLAPELARAHAAVRPIARTIVWGRNPDKARAVAQLLASEGFIAETAGDLRSAVEVADIVSCATLSTEPLVSGDWLKPGAHLDLVGGYRPDMREADDAAIRACRVFVDTRDGAQVEAGDLTQPIAAGVLSPAGIAGELADLCNHRIKGRLSDTECTLFKSVGTALEDLAAAELVWDRADK
jgi:ornithine cyclodeaminase